MQNLSNIRESQEVSSRVHHMTLNTIALISLLNRDSKPINGLQPL